MTPARVRQLLEAIRDGHCGVDEGVEALRELPFSELDFATVDHHRALRRGIPEVIYGERKRPEHLIAIFRELDSKGTSVLATRVEARTAEELCRAIPEVAYDAVARIAVLSRSEPRVWGHAPITVVAAGTSDLPIAEEAAVTAVALGNEVRRIYDVGVAGIHRVLARSAELARSGPIIVVAGMEGALPSVVAGLTASPVIAVPTSVGYGASFGGLAALLAMLSSCSSGVTVVNIDNGFGAAYAATQINRIGLEAPA